MRSSLVIAGALATAGLLGTALVQVKPAFADDQLAITGWGGAFQLSQRKAFFEPFTKATGIKIVEDEYNGEVAKVRAMVETKAVSWDVLDVSGGNAIQMCAEGIVETIDWSKIGVDRSKFLDGNKYDCAVPIAAVATIVAYDKDRLTNGPKTISDLFDLKKFPGKRGLWVDPAGNLEWALIADGVAPSDVYKVLQKPDGVDRALKKLDTIKKDVVWWKTGAQPPQLLADGQVIMTSAWNGRIYDAIKNSGKHFEIMWDTAQMAGDYWVIPKGSPHLESAYKFLAFASSPQAQANMTRYIPYAPGNTEAVALIDPAILPNIPTGRNIVNAQTTDVAFWAEHGSELRQRFSVWLSK